MASGARDYREDLDVLTLISQDKRAKETQQLKLQIATQCLVAMLSNSADWSSNSSENLTQYAWKCATTLVKLSEQEEKKK